ELPGLRPRLRADRRRPARRHRGARPVHVPHLVRTRRVRLRHRDRLRHAVPRARRDARAMARLGLRTEAAMRPRRGVAIARHVVLILGAATVVVPFLWMFTTSLQTRAETYTST